MYDDIWGTVEVQLTESIIETVGFQHAEFRSMRIKFWPTRPPAFWAKGIWGPLNYFRAVFLHSQARAPRVCCGEESGAHLARCGSGGGARVLGRCDPPLASRARADSGGRLLICYAMLRYADSGGRLLRHALPRPAVHLPARVQDVPRDHRAHLGRLLSPHRPQGRVPGATPPARLSPLACAQRTCQRSPLHRAFARRSQVVQFVLKIKAFQFVTPGLVLALNITVSYFLCIESLYHDNDSACLELQPGNRRREPNPRAAGAARPACRSQPADAPSRGRAGKESYFYFLMAMEGLRVVLVYYSGFLLATGRTRGGHEEILALEAVPPPPPTTSHHLPPPLRAPHLHPAGPHRRCAALDAPPSRAHLAVAVAVRCAWTRPTARSTA